MKWRESDQVAYTQTRRGLRPCTPVEQFDLETGEVLAVYPSQNNAMRATGISQNAICKCVNGSYGSAGGYGWRFARGRSTDEEDKMGMTLNEAKEIAKRRRMKGVVDELISEKEEAEAEARELLAELSLEELQRLRSEMK